MRVLTGIVAAAIALGVAVAVSAAQAPVPTVTVTASAGAVTATPGPVAPGATRFDFRGDGVEGGIYLASPKPGRTVDELVAALRSNPDASFEVADIVASASVTPEAGRAVTVEIEAGRTYVLVSDEGKENPAEWTVTTLATGGTPTGAAAPDADATVVMRDLRFGGASRLPRNGTIRVTNVGWAPHFAFAARLRGNARRGAVARAIESGRDRGLNRMLDFRNSLELTNILTRGASADQEVRFNRRGRYVLVCFFEGHNAQGMYRFVRVR